MTRPTKFEIMRINRDCAGYLNRKARLLAEMDSAELDVLRDVRKRQRKEREEQCTPTTQPLMPKPEEMLKLAAAIRTRRAERRRRWWQLFFWRRPAWQ